ncbi:hypothetical protein FHW16_005073 [Phyllobacterium myrsinacearum]|uniref:Uncharacterized protein n=1 Tax=Phyllobacterium myrsinacearum TaxID=28101 RepID=A0A839ET95_9HYPH|nr:hypothetical protein [Phyllobacterium myrsinacearum]
MIPASYLFRDIYRQHWGDPCDMKPLDLSHPRPGNGKGYLARAYSSVMTLFVRPAPSTPIMPNCSMSGR